jgi:hypothetical protein
MFMRERPYGERLWILNMTVRGVGSVVMRCMGWGLGRISGEVEGEFSNHTRFEVGDDSKIRFWHNMWCGGSFPQCS